MMNFSQTKLPRYSRSRTFGLIFLCLALTTAGCLKTRNDSRDNESRNVMGSVQRANSDSVNRLSELEDQMRGLNGRLEVIENNQRQSEGDSGSTRQMIGEANAGINQRLETLQLAMTQMETKIAELSHEIEAIKEQDSKKSKPPEKSADGKTREKNSFTLAEESFAQKDWKKAILTYKQYRDDNPKGKAYAEATYKIGVCFQELGMTNEAKIFFEEVISRFPKGNEAKRAKIRLKTLKK